jgi:diaminopimelate epimerase
MKIDFIKMHGCGNDFMIIDNRSGEYILSDEQIKYMAARKTGIGFDQLIMLDLSENAVVAMKIYNADGSSAGMCGNATRCIAGIIMDDTGEEEVVIEMPNGLVYAKAAPNEEVSVNLGVAIFNPSIIPIKSTLDPLAIKMDIDNLPDAIALSVGNPHLVFFLDKNHNLDINTLGPILENHSYFPDRINVSFAQVIGPNHISLNVWERGAGRTLACGSAAAATAAAAVKKGLCLSNDSIIIEMEGGTLKIDIDDDYKIAMTGPYKMVFKGTIDLENA